MGEIKAFSHGRGKVKILITKIKNLRTKISKLRTFGIKKSIRNWCSNKISRLNIVNIKNYRKIFNFKKLSTRIKNKITKILFVVILSGGIFCSTNLPVSNNIEHPFLIGNSIERSIGLETALKIEGGSSKDLTLPSFAILMWSLPSGEAFQPRPSLPQYWTNSNEEACRIWNTYNQKACLAPAWSYEIVSPKRQSSRLQECRFKREGVEVTFNLTQEQLDKKSQKHFHELNITMLKNETPVQAFERFIVEFTKDPNNIIVKGTLGAIRASKSNTTKPWKKESMIIKGILVYNDANNITAFFKLTVPSYEALQNESLKLKNWPSEELPLAEFVSIYPLKPEQAQWMKTDFNIQ